MTPSRFLLPSSVLIVALVFAGCGKKEEPKPAPKPAQMAPAPKEPTDRPVKPGPKVDELAAARIESGYVTVQYKTGRRGQFPVADLSEDDLTQLTAFATANPLAHGKSSVVVAKADAKPTFNKHGLSFDPPAGWRITSQETDGGSFIRVSGPQNATAVISYFKPGRDMPLEVYTASHIDGIARGLPALNIQFKETGRSIESGTITVKFVMTDKSGQKVPTTINISKLTLAGRTAFYVTQVIDASRPKVQPGFDQIRASLMAATTP